MFLDEKERVIKKLRFCAQKYRDVEKNRLTTERSKQIILTDTHSQVLVYGQRKNSCQTPCDPALSTRFSNQQDFSHHTTGVAILEPFNSHLNRYWTPSLNKIPTNDLTKMNSSLIVPQRFKTFSSTPREFLPRLRQDSELVAKIRSGDEEGGKLVTDPYSSGNISKVSQQASSKGNNNFINIVSCMFLFLVYPIKENRLY